MEFIHLHKDKSGIISKKLNFMKLILVIVIWSLITANSSGAEPNNLKSSPKVNITNEIITYATLREMAHSGKRDQAISLAKAYLINHEDYSIRILLARMLSWNKQYDPAREQLNHVLSKIPGNYDALDALSDIENWTHNYQSALEVIYLALKYYPNDEYLLEKKELITIKIMADEGKKVEAIQNGVNFLKDHSALSLRVYLAGLYVENLQYDEARQQLNYVINNKPQNIEAINLLAEIEINTGNYQKALDLINKGLKYAPKQPDLLINKQLALEKLYPKQYPPSTIPPILPKTQVAVSSGATYEEIRKLEQANQREKAIKLAQASLKQSDNSDIRILLGNMLSRNKQYDEARTQLKYVLKKTPDNADASIALANVELKSKNKEQALVIIDKGLKYNPKNATLLKMRETALTSSITYEEIKKLAKSEQYEKAKKLARESLRNKENLDIRTLLGLMESWTKNYSEAKSQFHMVLKNKPNYTDASIGLANVELWSKNPNEALKVVKNALSYNPQNKDLLKQKSEIMQSLIQPAPIAPGLFDTGNLVGPYSLGGKLNAVTIAHETSYVDDLEQYWRISSLSYQRYTPIGPLILAAYKTNRFDKPGEQYKIEGYPHLFKGAYANLVYAKSETSYLPKNYYRVEPYFALPKGFEISMGESVFQFQNSTTRVYTGYLGKYIGNYWFAFRPNYSTSHSRSVALTARRYFSSPLSYVSIVLLKGTGPTTFDRNDPDSISADNTSGIILNGYYPITDTLILSWLGSYSKEHYPTNRVRNIKTGFAGLILRF